MQVGARADVHLGYCTNIHAGESSDELLLMLREHAVRVKSRFCPERPLGLGLRISARAACELRSEDKLTALIDTLSELSLYVFTINGFPYGPFHGETIKDHVYEPDWTAPERREYTDDLAHILAAMLPENGVGSISTVPGCFRPKASTQACTKIVESLVEAVAGLFRLRESTGKEICLAIEPEPHCMLETSEEAACFFEAALFHRRAIEQLQALTHLDAAGAERALRTHLGVCLDACHAAVEFEDVVASIARFQKAGIKIAKAQLSCGLVVPCSDENAQRDLRAFEDETYLHQTVVRHGAELTRYLDLPEALRKETRAGGEWRVHYHVPIFLEELASFRTTQRSLIQLLQIQRQEPFTTHLEVETYTWDVLPERYRSVSVHEAIARELQWVVQELA